MVMRQNAMRRNLRQSIVKSFGRYIAIAMIIALGAGLFVGLLMSKTDMIETGQQYMDKQNMFDLRMISNYGWSEKYIDKFLQLDGIELVEGSVYFDLIARIGETEEDSVFRFYSIPENVNKIALMEGRLPERDDECLADGYFNQESLIGQTIIISEQNDEDSLEALCYREFTVVGLISTPLYMDMNRGTTSVGSGSLENYYYVPAQAFDVDYYTEINVTVHGDYPIYSDEYANAMDNLLDTLEPDAEKLSEQRFLDIKNEAEEEYAEGYQEYLDGVKEYENGKAEAEQELADALQELQDAEKELADNRKKLVKAGNDIEDGQEQINEGRYMLSQQETSCHASLDQVNSAIPGLEAYVSGGASYANAVKTAEANLAAAQDAVKNADPDANLDELQATVDEAASALKSAEADYAPFQKAEGELAGLKSSKATLEAALSRIPQEREKLDEMEKELDAGYAQLMVNWGRWHKAEDELAEGWVEYEDAKVEVAEELAEAEEELEDAKIELADARQEIDDMEAPDLIILERNSNVGYNNLDSSSDIVAGVSKVLPIFFLLVASLVCITTMTRMIDEERTQIGTLKALGYSNAAIIGKYMIYSGSGALLGCTLGIIAGCTIFPQIIWEAYKIMLYIQPEIVLTVDWPLAIAVVVVYTSVMLFVTWYSCRKTLKEEPAELIRPKAPDPGKKILMEYLPFWNNLQFLNKVTIRNIFRYRQRLAMMLVGIGGCTALLVTGFGLRDSLVNVVDFQFQDVTKYDLEVYFREEITPKTESLFLDAIHDADYLFYHQSSVEVEFNEVVKEIYMISSYRDIRSFIDMHIGDTKLSMPGTDEVVLTIGLAEMLGLEVGDSILLRNSDMESMEVTVSGIYENHVYNYCIVSPKTIESHWGSLPERQMAFVRLPDGADAYAVSAAITDIQDVMNVAVSSDLADMVGSMMKALDLVILLIVFCAGLLAVIVLYNLTNININERIREIATIKVLGFRAGETGSYVFKENLTLTVVGSLLGLLLGKLLLEFVMAQIKIDMVWFKTMITTESYLWAIVLTIVSAVIVDFVFYFKLQKINMAEALKSVE